MLHKIEDTLVTQLVSGFKNTFRINIMRFNLKFLLRARTSDYFYNQSYHNL